MNDSRSSVRPGNRSDSRPDRPRPRTYPQQQPQQPVPLSDRQAERIKRQALAERRRRKKKARLYARIRQIIMILIALVIGYLIGVQVGKASAAPAQLPAPSDPPVAAAPSGASEPPADSTPFLTPELPPVPQGPADTTAPRIMGVNKLSMFLGSTVAYRSGILLTDDTDPAPKLTVDSSQVNLSTPGTYPVIYTATDSAGNESSVETTITVVKAPDSYVEESVILEKADKILARILTEDMTLEQKVNTIYDYIESHHYYVAKFDKSDYMQAAYLMMTENRGDCFGYYALARLFFERLGIPNLTVTRTPNEVRPSNHWWNMVSLDGGETWYHYDSTPHLTHPTRTCLITDAALEEFNQLMPNYYYFDQDSFPKTPEQ